jgi:hypothetical protein
MGLGRQLTLYVGYDKYWWRPKIGGVGGPAITVMQSFKKTLKI